MTALDAKIDAIVAEFPSQELLKPYADEYDSASYNGSYSGSVIAQEKRDAFKKGWSARSDAISRIRALYSADLAASAARVAELEEALREARSACQGGSFDIDRDAYARRDAIKRIDAALGDRA